MLKPDEFELRVASMYQKKGYKTEVTPHSGDYGVDVFAWKGDERIAIQAKMYGGSTRKVNRATIMQLYGAAAYFECTKAVVVTDGIVLSDAMEVASKLKVEIVSMGVAYEEPTKQEHVVQPKETANRPKFLSFDDMWEQYVMPLKGKTLRNSRGENKILNVTWTELTRLTENGKRGKIAIEDFRLAYGKLIADGSVTRDFINQRCNRCSSGIVLVLGELPFVSTTPKPLTLHLNK